MCYGLQSQGRGSHGRTKQHSGGTGAEGGTVARRWAERTLVGPSVKLVQSLAKGIQGALSSSYNFCTSEHCLKTNKTVQPKVCSEVWGFPRACGPSSPWGGCGGRGVRISVHGASHLRTLQEHKALSGTQSFCKKKYKNSQHFSHGHHGHLFHRCGLSRRVGGDGRGGQGCGPAGRGASDGVLS